MGFNLKSFLGLGSRDVNTDSFTQPSQTGDPNGGRRISIFGVNQEIEDWVSFNDNEGNIYKTTPEVQLVIKKGAELFSNGRWVVKNAKDGSVIEDHEILNLLETPNAYQNRNEFLQDVYIKRCIYGNSMTYLNYPLKSSPLPATMTNLDTYLVSIVRTGKILKQTEIEKIIKEYRLKTDGVRYEKFEPNEIIHLRMPNPLDPIIGLSPLGSLMMPISNIRAGRGYIYADYVKKGAHGAFSPESKDVGGTLPFTESDKIDMEKQYSEKTHGSFQDQSSVLFLRKPVKWQSISSEIKNHMIHEEIEINFKRIIDSYGLNAGLFSFLNQSTFSNQENGEMQAYQNCILPFAESFSYAINHKLNLIDKGYYVELSYDHLPLFQADMKKEAETMKIKIENFKLLKESGFDDKEARTMSNLV